MDRALRIAVCDDHPEDLALLHTGIDAWLTDMPGVRGRVQEFASPAALCDRLRQGGSFDIYTCWTSSCRSWTASPWGV